MLRYITVEQSPNTALGELSLCVTLAPDNISGEGDFTFDVLENYLQQNKDTTCVTFVGGDNDAPYLISLASYIKSMHPNLKVAWFSNRDDIPEAYLVWFKYVKTGPYRARFGGLDKITTNQRVYEISSSGGIYKGRVDITNKFWAK